jgi:streptogramin lyase
VVDSANNNLQKWATAGGTLSPLMTVSSFTGAPTTFNGPSASGIDPVTGNVYVADQSNSQFEVFSSAGSYLTSFGKTELGTGAAKGVAVNSAGTTVYALDRDNHVVRAYLIGGTAGSPTYTDQSGSNIGSATLNYPWNVVLDSSNQVYVPDPGNGSLYKFNVSGTLLQTFTTGLSAPTDAAVDASGNVFVTDNNNNDVVEFNSSGTELGNFATLSSPQGLSLDPVSDNLFVLDTANQRIIVFPVN